MSGQALLTGASEPGAAASTLLMSAPPSKILRPYQLYGAPLPRGVTGLVTGLLGGSAEWAPMVAGWRGVVAGGLGVRNIGLQNAIYSKSKP